MRFSISSAIPRFNASTFIIISMPLGMITSLIGEVACRAQRKQAGEVNKFSPILNSTFQLFNRSTSSSHLRFHASTHLRIHAFSPLPEININIFQVKCF
jgi:hypothetical protein